MFDLLPQGDIKKWVTFIIAVGTAVLLSGLAGWGTAGYAAIKISGSPSYAIISGFFGGCLAAAVSGLQTARKHPLWKELMIALPKQLETVEAVPSERASELPDTERTRYLS